MNYFENLDNNLSSRARNDKVHFSILLERVILIEIIL